MIGWFSLQGNRRTEEKDQLVSHSRDVLEASASLRSHISNAAAARRAYSLWGDSRQIDAFNVEYKSALADFATLRKLTADNAEQQVSLTQMEPPMKARLLLLKESIELHQGTPDYPKQQDALTGQSARLSAQFIELIDKFDLAERLLLQQRTAAAQASYLRGTRINAFLGVFVFLFLILTVGFLNRELSRREKAERSSAEQKELLQSILDSCSDAVIVADTSGKIILRNPVGMRYNAGAPAQEIGEKYPQLLGLYKDDGETLFKTEELPLSRALRGDSVNGLEMFIRPPNGAEPRWMLAAGGPLLTTRGEKRGGVAFLRDITDRKKADEQLTVALLESETLARESKELSELGDSLHSCQTVEEAYKMSENALSGILGLRPGALCIINSSRDLVESAATWNNCTTTELLFHPDDCWGLRRGKPYGGPGSPMACSHVRASGAMNFLCVPLVAQGETLGVLYVEDKLSLLAPSPQAVQFEQSTLKRRSIAVAERISLALVNLKLRELLRAKRTGRNVSLVMLDLDHFKQFNDTFGHQGGDILLKEAAEVIKSRVRAGDIACRYGGEEFSLILAEVDTEGAQRCVENIRERIKHLSLHNRGQTLGTVTISAGIAAYPSDADSSEDLIHAADQALYRAKKAGRDCIFVYESLESGSKLTDRSA